MNYLRAAKRFWWIVLFGVAMACLTGLGLLYRVKSVMPPKLVNKSKPVFVASTELLVDSPTDPYLRTASKQVTPPRSTKTGRTQTTTSPLSTGSAVDTKTLIDAANLFPLFVESDEVVAIRRKLIGDIPGTVQAKALYSTQGVNRFRPSVIPVMQISASAPRPKFAIALAGGTARAFDLWLKRRQDSAKIPAAQRIVVHQLHAPRQAVATGGPAYGLPGLASLGVLGLFIALAVLLDQRIAVGRVAAGGRVSGELRPLPTGDGDATERGELGGLAASGVGSDKPLS
jgi:hypothetical protein